MLPHDEAASTATADPATPAPAASTRETTSMNVRKRAVVALTTAALGVGLAVGAPAAVAAPAPAAAVTSTAVNVPVTAAALPGTVTTAGDPARAEAGAPAAVRARWFNLYHGSRKSKFWHTPRVTSRSKVFQVAYRCWNGGDGTKVRIWIERKLYGEWHTMHTSRKWLCVGGTVHSRITNAKVGGAYRATIKLYGKKHTTEVWLQNYG